MMIFDFEQNYEHFNCQRQKEGLQRLFEYIVSSSEECSDLIGDILSVCVKYEADDYFGTEGLDI